MYYVKSITQKWKGGGNKNQEKTTSKPLNWKQKFRPLAAINEVLAEPW